MAPIFRQSGFRELSTVSLVDKAEFPAAEKCTYLNSASVALMYKGAEQVAVAWQRDIAENGTLNFDEVAEDKVFDDLRGAFAALIGATSDDIAVASCATEFIVSLAWAVAPGRGKNIVAADVVFPSTVYPWTRVARQTGCEMKWVKARDAVVAEEDLLAAIDENTAVVCLSHVEYGAGQRYNLAKIAGVAHAKGALVIVDATQSAGAIPIDVKREPVDALVTGSYKWLCGPFGVGLLYLAPHLQGSLDPGLVGWRSHKEIYALQADRLEYAPTARRFEFSTMAYGCAAALGTSIQYLRSIGIERIHEHNLRLAQLLIDKLHALDAEIVSPITGAERTSIVSARFPGHDSKAIIQQLGRAGVIVSPRRDFIRMSAHLYNTEEDIERLAAALLGIVGRRGRQRASW